MIKAAIDKILDLSDETLVNINDRVFIKPGYAPVKTPIAEPLKLHTLTGIRDYIESGVDDGIMMPAVTKSGITMLGDDEYHVSSPCNIIIHIVDYNHVNLITNITGPEKQRETRLSSHTHEHVHFNKKWHSVEDFIITLHSEFVVNDGSNYLKRITAGIVDSATSQIKDNGITQTAVIKSGIALVEEAEIENPVVLKPYRTFPEIEQPEIQCVFRIRKGSNGPECALFESDGGKWKSDTIQAIKAWFQNELNREISIIA